MLTRIQAHFFWTARNGGGSGVSRHIAVSFAAVDVRAGAHDASARACARVRNEFIMSFRHTRAWAASSAIFLNLS